jgi:hypothetical protein
MAADDIDEEYAALQYSFLDEDDDYPGEQAASEGGDGAKLTDPGPSEPDAPVVSSEPVMAAPAEATKPSAPTPASAPVKPPIPIIVPGMLKPTTAIAPTKSSNNQALDPFNLLVNHLPPGSNDQTLMGLFAPFGCVVSVKTFYDKQVAPGPNVRPRFGFVRFSNPTNAQQAMRALDGKATGMGAERLKVNHAYLKSAPKTMQELAQASPPNLSMMQQQQHRVCQHAQFLHVFLFLSQHST